MIKNDSKALKIVLLILSIMLLFTGVTCRSCSLKGERRIDASSIDLGGIGRIELRAAPGSGPVNITGGGRSRIEGSVKDWDVTEEDGLRTLRISLGSRPVSLTIAHDGELSGLEVRTTSGNISIDDVRGIGDVKLITTSGRIEAGDISVTGGFEASSTSGRIDLRDIVAEEIESRATSGTTVIDGEAGRAMSAESVSGSVRMVTRSTPAVGAKSVSGSIEIISDLACPDIGFASVSGRMKVDGEPFQESAAKKERDGEIGVETVSGNVTVRTR